MDGAKSVQAEFVDRQAPQTTIATHSTTKFRFRSSDPGSTFTCKLDKRKAARASPPRAYKVVFPRFRRHLTAWVERLRQGGVDPVQDMPAQRISLQ
jgi:hypothetical protein